MIHAASTNDNEASRRADEHVQSDNDDIYVNLTVYVQCSDCIYRQAYCNSAKTTYIAMAVHGVQSHDKNSSLTIFCRTQ